MASASPVAGPGCTFTTASPVLTALRASSFSCAPASSTARPEFNSAQSSVYAAPPQHPTPDGAVAEAAPTTARSDQLRTVASMASQLKLDDCAESALRLHLNEPIHPGHSRSSSCRQVLS